MRVVVQRCSQAKVIVNDKCISQIKKGLMLLICLEIGDNESNIQKAANKISTMRVFECPKSGKMDLSIIDIAAEVLAVSQFTLSWRGNKGNRPSFDQSLSGDKALNLFNYFCQLLSDKGLSVHKGSFGQNMQVQLYNEGPVTFSLDF